MNELASAYRNPKLSPRSSRRLTSRSMEALPGSPVSGLMSRTSRVQASSACTRWSSSEELYGLAITSFAPSRSPWTRSCSMLLAVTRITGM